MVVKKKKSQNDVGVKNNLGQALSGQLNYRLNGL
jgi:hypothetical protein